MVPEADPGLVHQPGQSPAGSLNLRRIFEAPRHLVWLAWTRPELTVLWLGSREWPAVRVTQDLRVGGEWNALLKSADGKGTLWQGGVYRVVAPPRHLVFTFAWGNGHEDGPPVETVVSVELTDLSGERTLMDFTQTGLKSAVSLDGHRHGWTSTFDRFNEWLANQSQKEETA